MKPSVNAPAPSAEAAAPGFNLVDLYAIAFRHKWKIVFFFILGVIGAGAYYFVKPPKYKSEAKILIRYIVEGKNAAPKDEAQMQSLNSGAASIMDSEIEILTSLDLAAQVADAVGPEKILAKRGGGSDRMAAAGVISGGLTCVVVRNSSVLLITFRHPDETVVQPVLSQLAEVYQKRHVEIHEGVGVLDVSFSHKAEELSSRLATTEAEIKKLKAEAQIISLDESKRSTMDLMSKISQELLSAETELAERRTLLGELAKDSVTATPATNAEPVVTPELAEQYRSAGRELEALQQSLLALRAKYTDEHPQVRNARRLVSEAEARKRELEVVYPQIVRLAPAPAGEAARGQIDLPTESRRVAALEAKIKWLGTQLEKAKTDASRVMNAEPTLTQLERQKEFEESSYRFYNAKLQQAHDDAALGAGKITNISVLQKPSPPSRDLKPVLKPMMVIFVLGCLGGFAFGFVSDRILDRTIKGVADVERQVRVPLFVSVPDFTWQPGFHLPKFKRRAPQVTVSSIATANDEGDSGADLAVAPWNPQHVLRAHFEGLRDRVLTHFEARDLQHKKPKLVAVTGYNRGAGVTTMAAGLATALSETGDGNVLLVDMNPEQGAVHPFYLGKPGCGLSEALVNETRDPALVQDKLYMVSVHDASNGKLPSVLSKRFAHLMPRLKASDYDYIIFDMPPVTQTSATARLSGFMDMVLVVIESEKTGSELVQRANGLLRESHANMAAVLNKHRAYVPQELSQEL